MSAFLRVSAPFQGVYGKSSLNAARVNKCQGLDLRVTLFISSVYALEDAGNLAATQAVVSPNEPYVANSNWRVAKGSQAVCQCVFASYGRLAWLLGNGQAIQPVVKIFHRILA